MQGLVGSDMSHKGHASGPSHELKNINWGLLDHKRIVTSLLVQDVYDRRRNPGAAGLSWVFRHFQVKEELIREGKTRVFGVVYELKPPQTPTASAANVPTYVIALRGTVPCVKKDVLENARIGFARLHHSSRFRMVRRAIGKYASNPPADGGPPKIVWITGHSLGASLATLVGKWMAKKRGVFGNSHETFLFNPPFGSAPINKIMPKPLRKPVRFANSFLTASLAKAVQNRNSRRSGSDDDDDDDDDDDEQEEEEEEEGSGNILELWVPHLFLNPADPVCLEYISYFEHRVNMKKIGAAKTERVASQHSKRALIANLFGIDSHPFYLLPSANLIINESSSQGFPQDHALEQWGQPDLKLKIKKFLWEDLS